MPANPLKSKSNNRFMALNKYIQSFRLRTLPLSMSGIILGSGMAWHMVGNSWQFWAVFALAMCTTLSLQILTNLSNELGDAQHGTDDGQQARVAYGLQAGAITEPEMRRVIGVFIGLCMLFGTALVWTAFSTLLCVEAGCFLLLGAFAIIGAMTYTLGKHSYGYMGLGDLGVFIFFGLLSTMGSFYLQAHTLTSQVTWAAVAIALPIVGVLNLNNIRDMDNDQAHGKHTFAGWIGKTAGKVYHTLLIVGCMAIFAGLGFWWTWLVWPVLIWHLIYIWRHQDAELDLQMPVLMFTTIVIAMLACIG